MKIIILLCFLFSMEQISGVKMRFRKSEKPKKLQLKELLQMEVPEVLPTLEEIETLSKVSLEGWIAVESPSFTSQRYADIKKEKDEKSGEGERSIELVEETDLDPAVKPPTLHLGFRKNIDFLAEGTTVKAMDQFYFRMTGNNIYYTKNEKDLVVLGAINVKNVQTVQNETKTGDHCFKVFDGEKDEWELCTADEDTKKKWFCGLKEILKEPCAEESAVSVIKEIKEEVILYQVPSPYCNEGWNYEQHGDDWDCLCKEGIQQSPIDLNPYLTCNPYDQPPSAKFEFKDMLSGDWKMYYDENLIKISCGSMQTEVCNNLNFGTISSGKSSFQGKEIHFHVPSDHMIAQKRFEMEIQAVYHSASKVGVQEFAVLSFLVSLDPGQTNDFMSSLDLTRIPNTLQTEDAFLAHKLKSVRLSDMFANKNENVLYADDFSYFYYKGSFTSPGCDEGVHWYIVAEPIKLGNAYIQMIKEASNDLPDLTEESSPDATYVNKNGDGTYRNIQKTQPKVFYHKSCDAKKTEDGHFEVVEQDAQYIYYQSRKEPSGITDAKQITTAEAIAEISGKPVVPETSVTPPVAPETSVTPPKTI